MEYYIDFDNTLYSTTKLKTKMLQTISNLCCKENKSLLYKNILFECEMMFCRDEIYNIYELCEYFAKKYDVDSSKLLDEIDNVLKNGKEFMYEDSSKFLASLKNLGLKLNILTYTAQEDLDYQKKKIAGSGLEEYFDKIIYTTKNKYELDIDYQNAVFIDDNPKQIVGLALKKAKKIIRVKRTDCKYSQVEIKNKNIIEIEDLYQNDILSYIAKI